MENKMVKVNEDINETIVEKIKKAISDYEEKIKNVSEKFNDDYFMKDMSSKEYRDALDNYGDYTNFLRDLLIIKIYIILHNH